MKILQKQKKYFLKKHRNLDNKGRSKKKHNLKFKYNKHIISLKHRHHGIQKIRLYKNQLKT